MTKRLLKITDSTFDHSNKLTDKKYIFKNRITSASISFVIV